MHDASKNTSTSSCTQGADSEPLPSAPYRDVTKDAFDTSSPLSGQNALQEGSADVKDAKVATRVMSQQATAHNGQPGELKTRIAFINGAAPEASGLVASHGLEGHTPICPIHQFAFAMLFSGYMPQAPQILQLRQRIGAISVPSFHCFGSAERDWQVQPRHSNDLASWFSDQDVSCVVKQHASGHMIPAGPIDVEEYVLFFDDAMGCSTAKCQTDD